MRASDLPTPGLLSNGQTLRHTAAHAISRAQINSDRSPDSDTAVQLLEFFSACATRCGELLDGYTLPTPNPPLMEYTLAGRPLVSDVPEGGSILVTDLPIGREQRRVNSNWVTVKRDVIIDTDWWTDSDDPVAIRVAIQLERLGHINIKGVAINTTHPIGPGSLDAFMIADGRLNNRIAAPKTPHTPTHEVGKYQPRLFEMPHVAGAPEDLPQNAVEMYRDILHNAPGKVDFIALGFYNNFAELLASPADDISPLTGLELVTQKGGTLYAMGGGWPDSASANIPASTAEYNFYRTPQAIAGSSYTVANWPGVIIFSGYEIGYPIFSGAPLEAYLPDDHLANVMNDRGDFPTSGAKGRPSWDPLKMLVGGIGLDGSGDVAKGMTALGYAVVRGTGVVSDVTGNNTWTNSPTGNHYYTRKVASDTVLRDHINSMLLPDFLPTVAPMLPGTSLPIPLEDNGTVEYTLGQKLVEEWNAADLTVEDGTEVQTWLGRKRGMPLSAQGDTSRPVFRKSVAGKPAMHFLNDLMNTAPIRLAPGFTIYIQARFDSTPSQNMSMATQDITGTAEGRSWHLKMTTTDCQAVTFVGTAGAVDNTPATVVPQQWHVPAMVRSPNQLEAYFDGTSNGPSSTGTPNAITQPISIGARGIGTEYLQGYINTVRIYEGSHDAATVAAITAEMLSAP